MDMKMTGSVSFKIIKMNEINEVAREVRLIKDKSHTSSYILTLYIKEFLGGM